MATRNRLPVGFSAFREDFGKVIQKRRRRDVGGQKALAHLLGVSRETISRIENGAVPRPYLLDRLLTALGLEMGAVALAGSSTRPQTPFDASTAGEMRVDLGLDLRRGRLGEGLSLRGLSDLCGLSAAQLSRIERGEATRSRVLKDHPDDGEDNPEHRRTIFKDPELYKLAKLGRASR